MKSQTFIACNRSLRDLLTRQGIDFIASGKLKLRQGDVCRQCRAQDMHFQEKGIDVKIVVDLMLDGRQGRDLYLVSSDTDLLPAITSSPANIIYVGFPQKPTAALAKAASKVVIFRESEILKAYDRQIFNQNYRCNLLENFEIISFF